MKEKSNVTFGVGPFVELPRIEGTSFTLNAALIVAMNDYSSGPNESVSGTNILLVTGEQFITSMKRADLVKHIERAPHLRLAEFQMVGCGVVYLDPNDVSRVSYTDYREAADEGYEGPQANIFLGGKHAGTLYRVKGTPEEIYAKLRSF